MTRLRLVTYRELRRVAGNRGFQWVRREGSHNTFRNEGGRIIVIPDPWLTSYRSFSPSQDLTGHRHKFGRVSPGTRRVVKQTRP